MSAPDRAANPRQQIAERLEDLPPLPRDEDGPVFAEPWQAQAFAMAVRLSEQGYFTWKEWASALADEIKAARSWDPLESTCRHASLSIL